MNLLVDTPSGKQELVIIGPGGGYFDPSRVVWDTRTDGALPDINLGGMVRSGNSLAFDQARMDQHTAAQAVIDAAAAQAAKTAADAATAKVDAKLAALAAMTPVQVRAWIAANVTNLADAKDVLATLAVAVSIIARKL